jgi:hypothetical protein
MVGHSTPELASYFGSRRQYGAVPLRRVIRVDVSDVRPAEPNSIEHERDIVESLVEGELERRRVPAALRPDNSTRPSASMTIE